MTLLAHYEESGEEQSLENHLSRVAEKAKSICKCKKLNFDEDIPRFLEILGLCHDFGKANKLFQKHLRGQNINPEKKQHSLISAFYTLVVLKEEGFSEKMQLFGWLIILKHHGDLENLFGIRDGLIVDKTSDSEKEILEFQIEKFDSEIEEIYNDFELNYIKDFKEAIYSESIFQELNDIYKRNGRQKFGKELENFYLILFCYSVLLDCDKMDTAGFEFNEWPSIGNIEPLPSDAVEMYKKDKGWDNPQTEINKMRQNASKEAEEAIEENLDLMTLTLPTGGGKTLTALNLALKMREKSDLERPPRIIYSLPFLSIIDQNYNVIEEVLGFSGVDKSPDILLRHDHQSPGYVATEDEEEHPSHPLLLTEGWNSEIINTTFVQFFKTLFTTRNSNARKFHKIVNSIILLDEIQSLPVKYWKPVEEAFKLLADKFNSKFILMTATQPEIIKGESVTEVIPEKSKNKFFEKLDRVNYEFKLDISSLEELKDDIINNIKPGKDLMAVMNTKSSAKELYQDMVNEVDREIIFLSTDILPKHRRERIEKIKNLDKPILVITTQLIEAGVDIDMDVIWRDFAPLDSIVQSAGRCNRENSGEKGTVKIIRLKDEHDNYLCNYVYGRGSSTGLLGYTEEVIEMFSDEISESEFNQNAVDNYFELVHERKNLDPDEISKKMRDLAFSKVDIELIENTESVPIFVRIEGSEEVYKKVSKAYEKNFFERRKEMQRLKSEFHEFIINAKVYGDKEKLSDLPHTDFSENFLEIDNEKIGKNSNIWYHKITGFQIPDSKIEDQII